MILDMPFGEWLPDRPDFKNALVTADGVVPRAGCYAPLSAMQSTGVAIPSGTVYGALRTDRADRTPVIYCGTASDLYTIVGNTVTASSLGLALGSNPRWSFERFNNLVYATAGGVMYSVASVEAATAFTAASGSPPQAKNIARIGDFLFAGNMSLDIDSSVAPFRIRWSQFNNPGGTWTDDIVTQAGAVDLDPSLGEVTGISGGRYGLACQKEGITRIAYAGGNVVFAKELIDEQHGCVAPASLVRIGGMAFGLGRDGFWQCNGASVQLLSSGRVWDWFLGTADPALIEYTQGGIDWVNRCIWWNFYTTGDTQKNRQLLWSWENNQWSAAKVRADWLFSSSRAGLDVDAAVFSGVMVDSLSTLVDASEYAPGGRIFGGFNGINVVSATGGTQEAVLETGELQPSPGQRVMVQGVRPVAEGDISGFRSSVGVKARLPSEVVVYSTETAPSAHGICAQRKDGRYVRVKTRVEAGSVWNKTSGVQIDYVPGAMA